MIKIISDTIQCHIAGFSELDNTYKFLVLQRSLKETFFPGFWQVITGTVQENETALQCSIREIKEEIGISATENQLFSLPYIANFFIPKTNSISLAPVFGLIIPLSSEIKISDEHQNFKWLDADEFDSTIKIQSHKEANKVFIETILNSNSHSIFKVNTNGK